MSRSNDPEYAPDAAESNGAAKLWSIYVKEAEKYDKSLVESWRSDMDGMLIFAGLFSASLTAFLVESYSNLTANSADTTVQLLTQISHQLSAMANNTTYTPPAQEPFKPATSSLVCNLFWFISLGLSLACALIATLLKQWAQDFLHRANMRSSPVARARVYSYLYDGLKRFKMHVIVDLIPALLHGALFFFFAGLIAFLLPVNKLMVAIVAAILGLALGTYMLLTILPLIASNSPYRTPMTNTFWKLYQQVNKTWGSIDLHQILVASPVENMLHEAQRATPRREDRDLHALSWVVHSLCGPEELENFLAAIPDAIGYPPTSTLYNKFFTSLQDESDYNLFSQIGSLFSSSSNGYLTPEASELQIDTCCRAIWALASIPSSSVSWKYTAKLLHDLRMKPLRNTGSAMVMLYWNMSLQLPKTIDAPGSYSTSFAEQAHTFLEQFELDYYSHWMVYRAKEQYRQITASSFSSSQQMQHKLCCHKMCNSSIVNHRRHRLP
ncbi:hypothetical protein HMN09_00337100 [Mycena chlorophos]|uniref:DUF6535 domain-containing protein n=1 Tax=Mycena chlorophos TaxID=658473 RepID=A0A8H6WGY6_MYCCL|nr:hypothetical protein HMN09_00337100 [Mycena chlorophos]